MKVKVLNILTGGIISDGITHSWLNFCSEFRKQGITQWLQMDFVYIEKLSDSYIENKFLNLGTRVFHLPSRLHNLLNYIYSLYRLLVSEKYDIIHVNGSSSLLFIEMLVAWGARIPIRISHSHNTKCSYNLLHNLLSPFFNCLCNVRLSCGIDAGKWLFGNRNFIVIHNGNELSTFKFSLDKRTLKRLELNLENKIVIGHVGKFNYQKNHRFLIDVYEKVHQYLPNTVLYLMGDGKLLNEIKFISVTKNLSDSIVFANVVSDMSLQLQAMDIMVFPSLFEGLPNVVLEWQASGLPCIISDVITHECAPSSLVDFISLEDSAEIWAQHICNVISKNYDRKLESQKAIQALKKEGFDISDATSSLINVYLKSLEFYGKS